MLVLVTVLLAAPIGGAWITAAPWLWPAVTLTLGIGVWLLTGWLRSTWARLGARLLAINLIFLLNAAFFASYYMQDRGFDETFFYHAQPDVIHAGLGEFLDIGLLFALAFVAVNLLTFLAGWAVAEGRRRALPVVGASVLTIVSLVSFPPLLSLSFHFWPDAVAGLPAAMTGEATQARVVMSDTDEILEELAEPPRLANERVGGKRPNLILLYLESVEQRYFDETLFPGLLPGLSALRDRSIHFPNMDQAPGTSWTIAGMAASQCGYPLLSSFRGGANDLGILPTFMPDAVCLGDLLSDAGYALSYLGGADHRFAGKGNFYRSHGFDSVLGFQDLIERLPDPDYRHHWGLFDDTLFDIAHDEFLSLAESGEPVGLVMLTLDTHHPDGYPSASCAPYEAIDNEILQAVHCTDQLASDFVQRIRETPFSDDTYIAIASDHLAMRNTATPLLNAPGEERRLTFFVNAPDRTGVDHQSRGLHHDIAPTLLDLLGIEFEGQIGLGRSLLAGDGYLPARIGVETARAAFPDRKLGDHIAGLWSLSSMTAQDGLAVDLEEGSVAFAGQTFDLMTKRQRSVLPTIFSFDRAQLGLTGLYQANPGEPEADELTDRMLKDSQSIHLAIGPYLTLEGMIDDGSGDRPVRHVAAEPGDFEEDDLVIYVGKAGAGGIVARPSSGAFDLQGSEIAKLAR